MECLWYLLVPLFLWLAFCVVTRPYVSEEIRDGDLYRTKKLKEGE